MTQRLTDRQREALLILATRGKDIDKRVQQGVWNSLKVRGLVARPGRHVHLTDAGRVAVEELTETGQAVT